MSKKVQFSARPTGPAAPVPAAVTDQDAIDAWVNNETPAVEEPVKRFTFEVPISLHKRIKRACLNQDRHMAVVIRELLETHFPPV
jgi:hypothetical protein